MGMKPEHLGRSEYSWNEEVGGEEEVEKRENKNKKENKKCIYYTPHCSTAVKVLC